MQKIQKVKHMKYNSYDLTKHLIDIFIISMPLTLMILFTYNAIIFKGIWTIDMTKYGEYDTEIMINLLWFIFLIIRGKTLYHKLISS